MPDGKRPMNWTKVSGVLKPVYSAWMKCARVLGWINTRFLLCVAFYLVITPIGLVLKLCGSDLLEMKIDIHKETYWKKKERLCNNADYQRQF
jgi:hypothetical protein